MDLRKLSTEQLKALKDKIVRLFAEGFSRALVLTLAGISRDQLKTLRHDQMFDHHIITAIDKAEQERNNVTKPKTA